jgi:hypothetical protein
MKHAKDMQRLLRFLKWVARVGGNDKSLYRGQQQNWPLLPKLALVTPRDDIRRDERAMVEEFRRHLPQFSVPESRNYWDLIALARHHGLATRLLDWTRNPLAALFFAIEKPLPKKSKPAVVWCVNPEARDQITDFVRKSPFEQSRTRFFMPRILSPRMQTQSGWFSFHSPAPKTGRFTPLEKDREFRGRIHSFKIDPSLFSSLRYALDHVGVNRATLFPDLDGLCGHITWAHTLESDERPRKRRQK